MKSQTSLHFSKLNEDSFERLCYSILTLLNPKTIKRCRGDQYKGRDIEVLLPILEKSSAHRDKHEEWWWVECKGGPNKVLDLQEMSPNIIFALKNNPPPPDMLFYMTTSHITDIAEQAIKNIKKDFRIMYLDGDDIREILLTNPQILYKFFPELTDKINNYTDKKDSTVKTRKIFLNAYRDFDYSNPVLRIRKGRTIKIDVKISNLTTQTWENIDMSLNLPKELRLMRSNFATINLKPFEKENISLNVEIEDNISNYKNLSAPQIALKKNQDCDITYSFSSIDYQHSLHFPFIGRKDELNTIVNQIMSSPCIILVEGLPGEGKTRLLKETINILERNECTVESFGSDALSNPSALFRSFSQCILDIYEIKTSKEIAKAYLNYQFMKANISSYELFLEFLLGNYKPSSEKFDEFINIIDKYLDVSIKRNFVIVMDDLHLISLPAMNFLERLLNTFGNKISFIISYRYNQIESKIRHRLLCLSEPPISIREMEDDKLLAILDEVTQFPQTVKNQLVKLSEGNLYCLIESLRLLKESKKAAFSDEGKFCETYEDSCANFNWSKKHLQKIKEYTYQLALRRYNSFLARQKDQKKIVEEVIMFLAAASNPLPISMLKKVFGTDILPLLDDLIDEQLLTVENYFATEKGVSLIHDRMTEALVDVSKKRQLFWGEINEKVADSLAVYLDKTLLPEYYQQIANHYAISGNMEKEIEFLFNHFKRSVFFQHNTEVDSAGNRCLQLIENLQDIKKNLTHEELKAEILLKMGISNHLKRDFNTMEKCFQVFEKVAPVSINTINILNVYRLTGKMLTNPQESKKLFLELDRCREFFEKLPKHTEEERDAYLHAINKSFIYYKKFEANYDAALELNKKAISLCQKNDLIGMYLWELINRGTLILFKDEEFRNTLSFSAMPSIWSEALSHWSSVLEQAEEKKIIEHLIETNCAVGFMKMYIGFHNNSSKNLQQESLSHFLRAREYAQRYSHPFWLCKLHNHLGVHNALRENYDESKNEIERGIHLAEKIENHYTIWMLYQNLANLALIENKMEELISCWEKAFEYALPRYFKDNEIAIKSYNFRLFARGFILHWLQHSELKDVLNKYLSLGNDILNDKGLRRFIEFCQKGNSDNLKELDMYVFKSSYFNTH